MRWGSIFVFGLLVGCTSPPTVQPAPRAPAPTAPRSLERADGTVAVVNGSPVLVSYVRARAARLAAKGTPASDAAALAQLVEERVVEFDFEDHHITVTSDEVDAHIEAAAKGKGMTRRQLIDAVVATHGTEQDYRDEVRREMAEAKWIEARVRPLVDSTTNIARERQRVIEVLRRAIYVELLPPPPSAASAAGACSDADALDPKRVETAEGKKIHAIAVCGAPDPLRTDAMAFLRTKPGHQFKIENLRSDLRSLVDSGYFRRVDLVVRGAGADFDVAFHVEPNKLARAYDVEGAAFAPGAKKTRELLSANSVFEPSSFLKGLDQVRRLYISEGFEDVRLEHVVTPDGADGVRVRAIVTEGPRSKIDALTIHGASKELEAVLRATPELAIGAPVTEAGFAAIVKRIDAIFSDRGLLAAKGNLNRERRSDGTSILVMNVEEGPVHRVAKVVLDLHDDALERDLAKVIRTKPGDVVDRSKVLADADRLKDAMKARGKPWTFVFVFPIVDEKAHKANVVFRREPD